MLTSVSATAAPAQPSSATPDSPYFILDHFGSPRQVLVLSSHQHSGLPRSFRVRPADGALVAERYWGRAYCMVAELTVFEDKIVQAASADLAAALLAR